MFKGCADHPTYILGVTITIINRYILKELIQPFCLCLGFLSLVFLLTRIITITDLVVNYRADISAVAAMLGYTLPVLMQYTLPMSVMMACLLTLLRMSADKEVVAIKTGGAGLSAIVFPVGLFCTAGALLTLFITVYAVPWGNFSYKKMIVKLAQVGVNAALKEGTFNTQFGQVMLYVDQIDSKDKSLKGVFIRDSRNPKSEVTITAPKGLRGYSEKERAITLRLFNAKALVMSRADESVDSLAIGTYDLRIPINRMTTDEDLEDKRRDEMTLPELLDYIEKEKSQGREARSVIMELHEKIALAVATLTLGLLSISLGLRGAFSRKGSGMGLGLSCFLFYYVLHASGWSLGKAGILPPWLAMWMGNILLGGLAIVFLVRISKEKTLGFDVVAKAICRCFSPFFKRFKKEKAA